MRNAPGRFRAAGVLAVTLTVSTAPAARAQTRVDVEMRDIELGERVVGDNVFRATLRNPADSAVLAVVDLRATPGMWLLPNTQSQFGFDLLPRESRSIEATYRFVRMSPEAALRVRAGAGARLEDGHFSLESISFEHRYLVGRDNPRALDPDQYFIREKREGLEIFAWRDSYASERIDAIAGERIAAISEIEALLDVVAPETIRLVLYPDGDIKREQMGHTGEGFASGTTIVEVHNETVQLDPYHELAHIVIERLGSMPAMLNEGLATYMAERLGAQALKYLGSGGLGVDQAACRFVADGSAFELSDLAALEEIGSAESRPTVSYPQSASVVKFLLERHGEDRFRALLHAVALSEGAPDEQIAAGIGTLGRSLAEVETDWRASVSESCR